MCFTLLLALNFTYLIRINPPTNDATYLNDDEDENDGAFLVIFSSNFQLVGRTFYYQQWYPNLSPILLNNYTVIAQNS